MEHRVTWFNIFDYTKRIVEYCKDKNFDCIMAVARGGSIIGTLLSYQLNLPIRYVGISSYDGNKKTENMRFTQHAEIGDYKNILVVDDIIDTGDTIGYIKDIIASNSFDKQFTYVTIYADEGMQGDVDYSLAVKAKEDWVIFHLYLLLPLTSKPLKNVLLQEKHMQTLFVLMQMSLIKISSFGLTLEDMALGQSIWILQML